MALMTDCEKRLAAALAEMEKYVKTPTGQILGCDGVCPTCDQLADCAAALEVRTLYYAFAMQQAAYYLDGINVREIL